MTKRSYISKVIIEGNDKKTVIIPFNKGLNIVFGDTDCGKSGQQCFPGRDYGRKPGKARQSKGTGVADRGCGRKADGYGSRAVRV